jgi:hypothetical protein
LGEQNLIITNAAGGIFLSSNYGKQVKNNKFPGRNIFKFCELVRRQHTLLRLGNAISRFFGLQAAIQGQRFLRPTVLYARRSSGRGSALCSDPAQFNSRF